MVSSLHGQEGCAAGLRHSQSDRVHMHQAWCGREGWVSWGCSPSRSLRHGANPSSAWNQGGLPGGRGIAAPRTSVPQSGNCLQRWCERGWMVGLTMVRVVLSSSRCSLKPGAVSAGQRMDLEREAGEAESLRHEGRGRRRPVP